MSQVRLTLITNLLGPSTPTPLIQSEHRKGVILTKGSNKCCFGNIYNSDVYIVNWQMFPVSICWCKWSALPRAPQQRNCFRMLEWDFSRNCFRSESHWPIRVLLGIAFNQYSGWSIALLQSTPPTEAAGLLERTLCGTVFAWSSWVLSELGSLIIIALTWVSWETANGRLGMMAVLRVRFASDSHSQWYPERLNNKKM